MVEFLRCSLNKSPKMVEGSARDAGVVRQASNDCAANKFGRWLPDCNHSADDFIGEQWPASVADIVVEELRKKEINGPIRLPKWDFFTRGQKVKDPWHILSGYDLEFAGMSTRERVRVMLEWFGRRQTIALPINSVVGCLIATILLMILSENNVRTQALRLPAWWGAQGTDPNACGKGHQQIYCLRDRNSVTNSTPDSIRVAMKARFRENRQAWRSLGGLCASGRRPSSRANSGRSDFLPLSTSVNSPTNSHAPALR